MPPLIFIKRGDAREMPQARTLSLLKISGSVELRRWGKERRVGGH
jgi:hypothetical protein